MKNLEDITNKTLSRVIKHSEICTSWNENLLILYYETLQKNPNLIVELGMGTSEIEWNGSNFIFSEIAQKTNIPFVSVDKFPNGEKLHNYSNWYFVNADNIEFAKGFEEYCIEKNIPTKIDVLFIDTSHIYKETLEEIRAWFNPHLAHHARVMMHDTNLKAWDNKRGVIGALEKHFDVSFDETKNFTGVYKNFLMRHYTDNNGLMILDRLD